MKLLVYSLENILIFNPLEIPVNSWIYLCFICILHWFHAPLCSEWETCLCYPSLSAEAWRAGCWESHRLLQTTSILSVWDESIIFISSVSNVTHKTLPKYQLHSYTSVNRLCLQISPINGYLFSTFLGPESMHVMEPWADSNIPILLSEMMKQAWGDLLTLIINVSLQIPEPGILPLYLLI